MHLSQPFRDGYAVTQLPADTPFDCSSSIDIVTNSIIELGGVRAKENWTRSQTQHAGLAAAPIDERLLARAFDTNFFVFVDFLGDDAILKNSGDLLVLPSNILDHGDPEFMWSMKIEESREVIDMDAVK